VKRLWTTWIAFGGVLAVLLVAMVSVTVSTLDLARDEAAARRQAALEENVRLALWRMDSNLAPLIGQENARPYFAYSAFYPAERAYNRMFEELRRGEVIVPSPLLTEAREHVLLHFQLAPDGTLSSPSVPTSNMRDRAETDYTTGEKIEAAARVLDDLGRRLDRKRLLAAFAEERTVPAQQLTVLEDSDPTLNNQSQLLAQSPEQQIVRNVNEYQARSRSFDQFSVQKGVDSPATSKPYKVTEPVFRAAWVGDVLILARRVRVNGSQYVQGCWLDWPSIRKWLLEDVRDLLPDAELEPVPDGAADRAARLLAGLPVRLVPGLVPAEPEPFLSPVGLSLVIAWGCVAVAGVAVGLLLVGAVSLSERRATFVSAVTHEMRTPLTTFQMYSEMLAEDMVTDAEKRRTYLATLCSEAERLSHLVENVLAYARLERGRRRSQLADLPVNGLLARADDRLGRRAEQAGMALVVEPNDAAEASVRAEGSAVEQILLNLVDNACKYAAGAEDRRIHLDAHRTDGSIELTVRDHGHGISPDDRRRLFRPFSKSARDAAHSAPGIGLGLALSRRLARDMGGELLLDGSATQGAAFTLSLPLA